MITIANEATTYDRVRAEVRTLLPRKLQPGRGWLSNQGTDEESVALSTLAIWCALPAPGRPSGTGPSDLRDAYFKEFASVEALVDALVGHVRAGPARDAEETLAYRVLGNLSCYEHIALDPVVSQLLGLLDEKGRLAWFLETVDAKAFYGYGSRLPHGADAQSVMNATNRLPELERLYIKVATLHHFGRYCGKYFQLPSTPGRGDHAAMRVGKYSLDESHPQVRADRAAGVSIWAGTSGSAMDMLHLVKALDLGEQGKLEALAWCIFAFFHFMPTVASPTHTFHEVMRGARQIIGAMDSYAGGNEIPATDFAKRHNLRDAT